MEINKSLIRIDITKDEWEKQYTFGARCNMRIFSWIFPGVLKIYILKANTLK